MRKIINDSNLKLITIVAFIAGIIAHGEMIFYKISMGDDISIFFSSCGIEQGRWAGREYDKIVRALFGQKYSTPVFGGGLSIFLIAICAWLTVDLLEIKDRLTIVAITIIMVIYPAVVQIFYFMLCAPSFFIAMFLCVLSAWLTAKIKFGWIYSVPLIAISLGIYQAYLSYFLGILFLLGIKKATENLSEYRKLFFSGLLASGGGVVSYLLILKFYEKKYDIYATYKGMDHMLDPNIIGRLSSIRKCYLDYLMILKNDYIPLQTTTFMTWMYRLAFVFLLCSVFMYVLSNKNRSSLSVCLALISFVLIPIGTNAIYILGNEDTDVGFYTLYPMVISLISIPTILEWRKNQSEDTQIVFIDKLKNKCKMIEFIFYIPFLFLCLNYAYIDNATYMRYSFLQEKIISYQTTLVTRIKSMPGYKDEYPVIWIGECNISDASTVESIEWKDLKLASSYQKMINNYAWREFMNEHVGYNPEEVAAEGIPTKIKEKITKMPSYPNDGSIAILDEYVVVKFSDQDID